MQQRSSNQNISDNSYLSRFKEDISSKQKTIRDRLGLDQNRPRNDEYEPNTNKSLYKSSIPSIDDDNVLEQVTHERNYRSSRYFDDDAEESLQFFKKNLMRKINPIESQETKIKSTSDRNLSNPRISMKDNELDRVRENKPMSANRFLDTRSERIDKIPSVTTPRPLPIKQTSLSELKIEKQNSHAHEQPSSDKETPVSRRPLATLTTPLPKSFQDANTNKYESADSYNHRNQPISTTIKKPIQFDNDKIQRSDKAAEMKELPSCQRSPEPFSRKPLQSSLLRAHDSIRLKVNRPKVRPKSESKVEDNVIDDDHIDSNKDSAKTNQLDADRESFKQQDEPNERAIDVKRWSLRRRSKSKKNKQNEEENKPEVPVRNFLDVRVVKIIRSEDEPSIGVTVRAEEGNIVVARIMAGSLADKQGVLQVGDIILTVNNREIYTPEQLQEEVRKTINDEYILMKIVPSFREELPTLCLYLRALFAYDPNEDTLLPCKEVGVGFNQGDILEVVNQEDPNWWQARRVDSENLQTGLIPSQELEERRRAFVLPDYDLATKTSICGTRVTRKSKKKEIYNIGLNNDFDKAELQLYEEVCRTPPFERRTLVLIGANGVGKQVLKARLLAMDPDRFGSCLAHTSRLPREGEEDGLHYHFVTRERMEEDIIDGKYLEYGEYDGALYGTKLDSIREVIGQGKICVLDCSPTCLKILKTPDYLPFVAFIAAPTLDQFRYMQNDFLSKGNQRNIYGTFDRALSRQSRRAKTLQDFAFDFFEDEDLQVTIEESARLLRMYENYFDIVLVNNHYERTFEQLRDAIDALSMAPQWIPISWIYGS